MRVLWISQLLPYPPKGGVRQRSFNLLKEVSREHTLDFIGFSQRSHQPDDKALRDASAVLGEFCNDVEIHRMAADRSAVTKFFVALYSVLRGVPYSTAWLRTKAFKQGIEAKVKETKYDLIHFDTIGLCQYLPAFDAPIFVINHHNVESHMMSRRAARAKNAITRKFFELESKRIEQEEKHFASLADLNLTCSSLDADRLSSVAGPINVSVVPNGVDLSYFVPTGAAQKKNSLIFVGGLSWYPNRDAMTYFLEEVWPMLKSRRPEIRMLIAGRNPPAWMTEFAGRTEGLEVPGFVDDIRIVLEESAVFVCPIRDGGGTKLKILDALAMKKAIVAHPVACEGIDVVDGKHVVMAADSEQFASSILELLDRDEKRYQLGEAGRCLVESNFDFAVIGKKLADKFTELVALRKSELAEPARSGY